MKKLIVAVSLFSMFVLTSCSSNISSESFIEGLSEYNSNLESYYSNVTLEITKNDSNVKFECDVYYLADDFYKVIMKDMQTNNTQAIVKNTDGVSVLTPLLNKQFKFNNDWPLNSSHAYLMQSIVKDIINDESATVINDDTNYVVTSTYNSKTNASLKEQKVTFNKEYKPIFCIVLNEAKETQIKATFNEFVEGYSLKAQDFDTNSITTSLGLEMGEGVFNNNIEDTIPTYTPNNTEITTSVVKDDYVIYNYSGDANYTITCAVVEEDEVLGVYRTYDDLVLLSSGLGAYTDTSVTFYQGNIQVTIYSDSLDIEVLVEIANSF